MSKERVKNYDDLELLADCFSKPAMSVKFLNTVYAIRNAWASRGYLLERERKILVAQSAHCPSLSEYVQSTPDEPEVKEESKSVVTPKQTKQKAPRRSSNNV